MNGLNPSELPTAWQVCPTPSSLWDRLSREFPLLSDLERGVRQLDPPEGPAQFWRTWHAIEHRLAEIFDGPLRPPLGTDHDRAWNHLFVRFDNSADRRTA